MVALLAPAASAAECTGYLVISSSDTSLVPIVSFVTEPGLNERVAFEPRGSAYTWHVSSAADTYVTLINLGSDSSPARLTYHAPDTTILARQDMIVPPGMTVATAGAVMPTCRTVIPPG
jgi:hypothetical protein